MVSNVAVGVQPVRYGRAMPLTRAVAAPERERDLDQHLPNNEANDPAPVEAVGSEIRDLQLRLGYQLLRGMIRARAAAAHPPPPAASPAPRNPTLLRN